MCPQEKDLCDSACFLGVGVKWDRAAHIVFRGPICVPVSMACGPLSLDSVLLDSLAESGPAQAQLGRQGSLAEPLGQGPADDRSLDPGV